jgi:hypothetical protein
VVVVVEGDGMNLTRVPTVAVTVEEATEEVDTVVEAMKEVALEEEGALEVAAGIWTACSWPSLTSATFPNLRRTFT